MRLLFLGLTGLVCFLSIEAGAKVTQLDLDSVTLPDGSPMPASEIVALFINDNGRLILRTKNPEAGIALQSGNHPHLSYSDGSVAVDLGSAHEMLGAFSVSSASDVWLAPKQWPMGQGPFQGAGSFRVRFNKQWGAEGVDAAYITSRDIFRRLEEPSASVAEEDFVWHRLENPLRTLEVRDSAAHKPQIAPVAFGTLDLDGKGFVIPPFHVNNKLDTSGTFVLVAKSGSESEDDWRYWKLDKIATQNPARGRAGYFWPERWTFEVRDTPDDLLTNDISMTGPAVGVMGGDVSMSCSFNKLVSGTQRKMPPPTSGVIVRHIGD